MGLDPQAQFARATWQVFRGDETGVTRRGVLREQVSYVVPFAAMFWVTNGCTIPVAGL